MNQAEQLLYNSVKEALERLYTLSNAAITFQ